MLSYLLSLFFPTLFPLDFMHLVYENILQNLVLLWTGHFKGIDQGSGTYELVPAVWTAIGDATAASGNTIPSIYGAQPLDMATNRKACTADS